MKIRKAVRKDMSDVAEIYNQGIEDRLATLETDLRTRRDMERWLEEREPRYSVLVAEDENEVVGWAAINPFSPRRCYRGVGSLSVYIRRDRRGSGIGKKLLAELNEMAKEDGFHKIVLSTFDHNAAGQGLYKSTGFSLVGTYRKQGMLDGQWVDVTLMEKLLTDEEE